MSELIAAAVKAITELTGSLKGIELPAALIIILMVVAFILWSSRDKTAPNLAASSMTMATTLINRDEEKSDMILKLMSEQSDTRLKVVHLQNQMHQMEQRLEEAETSRKNLSDEIVKLNLRVVELTKEVDEEREQKMKLLLSIADLQRQLDQKDQEILGLRSQMSDLQVKTETIIDGELVK